MQTKYIFVTGGVVSGLGRHHRGLLGRLLKPRDYTSPPRSWTPTSTWDPGNHGPHGEVFVTEDGAETDLDLGHYERFMRRPQPVLQPDHRQGLMERADQGARRAIPRGNRAGHPHITNEIKSFIYSVGRRATPTWLSPRSAAPPATSRASPSWRPSARSPTRWAGETACSSM